MALEDVTYVAWDTEKLQEPLGFEGVWMRFDWCRLARGKSGCEVDWGEAGKTDADLGVFCATRCCCFCNMLGDAGDE